MERQISELRAKVSEFANSDVAAFTKKVRPHHQVFGAAAPPPPLQGGGEL